MIGFNTNLVALRTMGSQRKATEAMQRSLRKLSTGHRVNRAADDAASLAISHKFTARARSMHVAMRNANDGISMVQTADSTLATIANMLSRMRELAVQASSQTLTSSDRSFINEEFATLQTEFSRIKDATEFNGRKLIDGTLSKLRLQVGVDDSVDDRLLLSANDAAQSAGPIIVGGAIAPVGPSGGAIIDLETNRATRAEPSQALWGQVSWEGEGAVY